MTLQGFRDVAGRTWCPEVNVLTIGRVRKAVGVNLLEILVPNSTLADRLDDPCLLADILYLACKDEADKQGVGPEEFGRAQTADTLTEGWSALLEGLVSFCRSGLRPAYQKVLKKARQAMAAEEKRVADLVASPAFDQAIDQAIQRATSQPMPSQPSTSPSGCTGDASSLPESPASNPGTTPSPS